MFCLSRGDDAPTATEDNMTTDATVVNDTDFLFYVVGESAADQEEYDRIRHVFSIASDLGMRIERRAERRMEAGRERRIRNIQGEDW